METELKLLKQELYGDSRTSIADIKFYPGTANASPEDVARETRKAIAAFKTGNCAPIPLSIPK